MKKFIRTAVIASAMMAAMLVSSYAAQKTDFYNQDALSLASGTITRDGSLTFPAATKFEENNDIYRYFHTVTPYLSQFEADHTSDGQKFIISSKTLDEMTMKANAVEQEADMVVHTILREGMTEKEAVNALALYVKSTYPYDYEGLSDIEQIAKEQSAYYMIMNKKGVCASLSKFFKALCDKTPLDAAGRVNFTSGNIHVNAVTVSGISSTLNANHMWTEVRYSDGTEAVYDVTNTPFPKMKDTFYTEMKIGR